MEPPSVTRVDPSVWVMSTSTAFLSITCTGTESTSRPSRRRLPVRTRDRFDVGLAEVRREMAAQGKRSAHELSTATRQILLANVAIWDTTVAAVVLS